MRVFTATMVGAACALAAALSAGSGQAATAETAKVSVGTYSGTWAATFPPSGSPAGEISFRLLSGKDDAKARQKFDHSLAGCSAIGGSMLYRGNYNYGGKGRVEACHNPINNELEGYYVNKGGVRRSGHGTFTIEVGAPNGSGQPTWSGQYSERTQDPGSFNPENLPWHGHRLFSFSRAEFELKGYANNVKVVPPLVGKFQLGKSKVKGSGLIDIVTGKIRGRFTDKDRLRRGTHKIGEKAITASIKAKGEQTTLVMRTKVTSSNRTDLCPRKTIGKWKITDRPDLLANGHPRDGIAISHPQSGGPKKNSKGRTACVTHVHGYNNSDGGERTSPQHGGPPNGGQWAIVEIDRS